MAVTADFDTSLHEARDSTSWPKNHKCTNTYIYIGLHVTIFKHVFRKIRREGIGDFLSSFRIGITFPLAASSKRLKTAEVHL